MNSSSHDYSDGNLNTELSALIRKKRQELEFSLQTVADYVGITVSELEVCESGTKPIPLNIIHSLSNCLSISPEKILAILDKI